MNRLTTITIRQNNYERLRNLGKTGESFNDVLTRILDQKRGTREMMTNRPTRYYLANKLNQIRRLLNQGETGKGISKKMNLPLRTAERYIQRVYEQDKESWSSLATESLEHRSLIIKSHYEKLAKIHSATKLFV